MASVFSYWAFFGVFYLGILTYMDFKNNMLVDDRHNYFMMGVTASLISHTTATLTKVTILIVMLLVLGFLLSKYKVFGSADKKSILWIFSGFLIIGYDYLTIFIILFLVFTILYFTAKYLLMTKQKIDFTLPTPYYWVLLFSFISTTLIKGMW